MADQAKPGAVPAKKLVRIGGILTGVVVVALIAWLALDGDDSSSSADGGSSEPTIVSVDTLRDEAASQDTPIYWAGAQAGTELELSRPEEGQSYVRYLPEGAEAGDPRPFLTVGSYQVPDPVGTLRRQGNQADGVLATAPGDGTVYFSRTQPRSVYLAYPGEDVQIEVYAPDFRQALQLAKSGQIVPVE